MSRVVNGQGEITEATRARVLEVVRQMDYRPNALARSLVSGKSSAVALIIPQITDPFYPQVMLGVEAVARQHGYSVFLCNTNDDPEQELAYVDVLAGKRVDGVILCGSRLNAAQLADVARHHRVSILSSRKPQGSAVLALPGETGLFTMTSHLIDLGHRKVGHVGSGPIDEPERVLGYQRAMLEHGLDADPRWVIHIPKLSIESSYRAARELLLRAPEVTALSCFDDLAAIGALRACAELGRRVPEDIAIVGFDDIELASLVSPALTTMHVPRYEIGMMAMEQLLRVIGADGKLVERIDIKVEKVVRQSCGASLGPTRLQADPSLGDRQTILAGPAG